MYCRVLVSQSFCSISINIFSFGSINGTADTLGESMTILSATLIICFGMGVVGGRAVVLMGVSKWVTIGSTVPCNLFNLFCRILLLKLIIILIQDVYMYIVVIKDSAFGRNLHDLPRPCCTMSCKYLV